MGASYEVIAKVKDKEAWLQARREGIGGSDAAAILGVSPWSSAIEIYADKISSDPVSMDSPSEAARWGTILEPHVIDEFRSRTGRVVKREGRLLRSRARPWQMATLDARQRKRPSGPPGLVEVKTTRFEWDRIPEDIWAQVQHQFAVTKMRYGSIVIFNRTSCETSIIDVEPDRDYIGELTEIESKFWADLCNGIPPAPDGSDSARATLRSLYPEEAEGKEIALDDELIKVGSALEAAKQARKAIGSEIQECENELIAAIGDAEVGLLADGTKYTYRTQHRREVVQAAVSFRVLRRKGAK